MLKLTPILCAAAFFAATPAMADVVVNQEGGLEFRNYVSQFKPRAVVIEGDVDVGTAVPDTVELLPVPDTVVTVDPGLKTYNYVYVGDRIALVDPNTRQIVAFVK